MLKSRFVIPLAAIVEMVTGLTILIVPRLFVLLLLGAAVDQNAIVVARICGLALLAFGLACWPQKQTPAALGGLAPLRGLLTYNGLLAIYLVCLEISGGYHGVLLLPAIILHAVLTLLLINHFVRVEALKP